MTQDDVKKALLEVLDKVQKTSGQPSPSLNGSEVPSTVLPKFDSTVWPVATSWLAKKLDIVIPNDVHIFGGKAGAPLLTIDQTVEIVMKKHAIAPAVPVAAE